MDKDLKVLIIIGPSGSGKSTIAKKLVENNIINITPSWTTRPMRPSEKSSYNPEHVFVSQEEFEEMQSKNGFLEAVQLFNLPYWYGLPRVEQPDSGIIPAIMLRAPIVKLIEKHYPNHVIYEIHSPVEQLHNRLKSRQQLGDNLGTRLDDVSSEIELGNKLAHRVFVNDRDIEDIVSEISQSLTEDMQ